MKPYSVGHPIATALFVATLLVFAISQGRQSFQRRSEATLMDRGSRGILALCWIVGVLMAALVRTKVPAAALPNTAVTFGLGLVVVWLGLGLRWWSFRTLGRYFTFEVMASADQQVITTGPYRLVRHPSYTGLLLIFAGIGLLLANWLSLAALLLSSLIGLLYRIHVEEAALAATVGDAYRSYAARHKRLLPFLW